jgi:hypothetical protein
VAGKVLESREEPAISAEAAGIVENEYGRAMRELGLPGATLFVVLLGVALQGTVAACRRCQTARYRLPAAACVGVVVSILVQLAAGSALYVAPGGLLFWLAYALALRLPQIEAAELKTEEIHIPALATAVAK